MSVLCEQVETEEKDSDGDQAPTFGVDLKVRIEGAREHQSSSCRTETPREITNTLNRVPQSSQVNGACLFTSDNTSAGAFSSSKVLSEQAPPFD
jgi:hypothetical protein